MEQVETVIIGAGVVGLAIARHLALAGQEVIVLEAESLIGSGTSSRNSEVIHAGIYYPQGSLKARLCVAGRQMIYDYIKRRRIPHEACGKIIVATAEEQHDRLLGLQAKAIANGVDSLVWLTRAQVEALEPEITCTEALLSPVSGIIDSHALMLSFQADLEEHGGMVVFRSPLQAAEVRGDGIELLVGGSDPLRLRTRNLINAAGLGAQKLATAIEGLPSTFVPPLRLAKGNYYGLSGRNPFRRLVYPLPEPGGLGVHVTIDLGGQARFGPDVEWIDRETYDVDPGRAERFYAAVRRYWPGLPTGALIPAYAGIRPKLVGPGESDSDFVIQGPTEHGIAGLVNLFGIESPGLTSCMAIAAEVAERLR
ncbi:FAD-dependent oxidoreductase [Niveispirillum sp. SYP-B3756]|uniref:NAD(P)/FAD-dependent oxidoreductase n=1 Tax=Niveispirillum sp. SYP-B3756 TaxID=2662178 RepID=UPI00135D8116|nr:FAD-dependent oxidoreductase [Niveispirillum sp. SYP-B3756]